MSASPPHHPKAPVLDVFRAGELLKVLRAYRKGDFSARLGSQYSGSAGEIAQTLNDVCGQSGCRRHLVAVLGQ